MPTTRKIYFCELFGRQKLWRKMILVDYLKNHPKIYQIEAVLTIPTLLLSAEYSQAKRILFALLSMSALSASNIAHEYSVIARKRSVKAIR
ncbi:MAG: hypothetical protein P9L92_08110 [Candidatus Electryonea clarkiae]|nr:hypothetical protein [Candidatus Electryonea clarkiae]MDP8285612.1 hypothetical protein [Candidatus Electryonea clarkiae]